MAETVCSKCKRPVPDGMGSCLWCGTVVPSEVPAPPKPRAPAAHVPPPPPPGARPGGTRARVEGKALCPVCMNSFAADELVESSGQRVCPACAGSKAAAAPPPGTPAAGGTRHASPVREPGDRMTLQVKVTNATIAGSIDPSNAQWEGKGELELSEASLVLRMTGMLTGKQQAALPWEDVRELKNELRTKNRFDVRVSGALVRIKVQPADAPRLARVFERLPPEVGGEKCPKCGGLSMHGVCRSCGARPADARRMAGLGTLALGILATVFGAGATMLSYNAAKPGEEFSIFAYPIGIGVLLIIGGVAQLISGR